MSGKPGNDLANPRNTTPAGPDMDGDHPEDLQKDRNPKLMNSPRRNATTMGDPMRRLALTALFCVLLATSACAEDQASAGSRPELPEESSAETTTQEDKDEPETNERGNIPKKLKEEAGLIHERGDSSAVFAIDEIKVDPECHEYGVKPDKGHTLLLHVRVATGVEADANDAMSLLLNPYNFAELGSDGVTSPASSGMCTDPDEYLPMQFGMNQKYRGTIEVVVPEASGTLILTNYGGRGWEWTYPTDEK